MFRRATCFLLALATTGCVPDGSPDDLGLSVDTTTDPPVFDWAEDVAVHRLAVFTSPDGPVRCVDGEVESGEFVWVAVTPGEPMWKEEPVIERPVVYADPDLPSDARYNAVDLELVAGRTYAAEIVLIDPSGTVVGDGCVTFVP